MLQKLAQARQSGVACIVAAGNSGDAVQFPGVSPDVLTVAAIGKLGEFPADSFHARQVPADGPIDKGYFSATFSCQHDPRSMCAHPESPSSPLCHPTASLPGTALQWPPRT